MPIAEMLYFQADQGYVSAVSTHSQLLLEDSLRALEEEFAEDFVRIHRNALVAPAHVRGLERDGEGNVSVVFEGRPEKPDGEPAFDGAGQEAFAVGLKPRPLPCGSDSV